MLLPHSPTLRVILFGLLFTLLKLPCFAQSLALSKTPDLYPQLYAAKLGSEEYQKVVFELMDAARSNAPDTTIKYCLLSLKYNPTKRQPHHFHAGYMLADAWSIKGDFKLADSLFEVYAPEIPLCKDSMLLADFYNCRGVNSITLGNAESSIRDFKMAYPFIRYSNPSDASKCIANVANIFSDIDQEDSCIFYNLMALKLRLEIQDTNGIESSYSNIGTVYYDKHEFRTAIDHYHTADQLRGYPHYKVCAIGPNLVHAYKNLGMKDSAFYWSAKVNSAARSMNSKGLIATADFLYGELLLHYGQADSALAYMTKALPVFESKNDTMGNRIHYLTLGNAYLQLKQYKKAYHYLDIAYRYNLAFNDRNFLLASMRDFGKAKLGVNGSEDLILWFEQTEKFTDSIHALKLSSIEHELLVQYETEKSENALLQSELELKTSQSLISTQRRWLFGLLLLTFVLSISILLFRRYQQLKSREKDALNRNRINEESMRMVIAGEEKERQRIARDLHDGLGQQLSMVHLKLENLKHNYNEGGVPPKELEQLQEEISRLSDELRRISHAMMPAILVHGNFLQVLNGLINKDYHGVLIDWNIDNQIGPGFKLKKEVQHTLYRIIQEAISNSYKHGQAAQISLTIKKEGEFLFMTYKDNGKGFNPKQVKTGLGLSNIQQRVQALNGQTHIETTPNKGFKMDLRFPFEEVSH